MSATSAKTGLTILQWTLGVVILIEAVLFVLPSAAHEFARTHMPGFIQLVLGWRRDRRLHLSADSENCNSGGMVAGCRFRIRDSDSSAARSVQRGQSCNLCGGGAGGGNRQVRQGGVGRLLVREPDGSVALRPGGAGQTAGGGCPHILLSGEVPLNNEELIRCFEGDAVPEDSFHHADHVRLGFAYLSAYPPLQALERFSSALKAFATARGKSQLYHETITHAYFFLIRERMARSGSEDWEELAVRVIPTF